jgi:hypothetical protein
MIYPNDLVQEDIGPKSPASKRGKIPKAIYAGGNLGTFTTFYIISADTIGGETSGPKLVAQTERSPVPRENNVGYVPSGHYSLVTIPPWSLSPRKGPPYILVTYLRVW